MTTITQQLEAKKNIQIIFSNAKKNNYRLKKKNFYEQEDTLEQKINTVKYLIGKSELNYKLNQENKRTYIYDDLYFFIRETCKLLGMSIKMYIIDSVYYIELKNNEEILFYKTPKRKIKKTSAKGLNPFGIERLCFERTNLFLLNSIFSFEYIKI